MTPKVKSSTLTIMKRLLPLLMLFASSAVLAESGAYQVEVIVFRHLLANAELNDATALRSFSGFPDLEENKQTESLLESSAEDPAEERINPGADPLNTDPLVDESYKRSRIDLPDDLYVITEKSSRMDATWKRLRSSKAYRPLLYAAWEQNQVDYYPPIRIHDQQVIDTRLQAPTNILRAKLTAQDPLAAYRSNFYQIDGSLQLRRSRFLHLYLDLELREEASLDRDKSEAIESMTGEIVFATDKPRTFADAGMSGTDAYGVYALKQNRQISTGKMQYFDTPYFGALVYVTNVPGN